MLSISGASPFGGIIFGAVGLAAFIYGKKQASFKPMLIGILLMVFPYFISNTVIVFVIGSLLIAALFVFRD